MKSFSELGKLRVEVDVFKVFTVLFALVICYQSIIIANSTNVKTIITPSNLSKSFTYINNEFSESYFNDTGFLLSTALYNVSPENVDESFFLVSKYFTTDPKKRKKIRDYLLENAKNIKDEDITQTFHPKNVLVDYKKGIFTVIGTLSTIDGNIFVGSKRAAIDFYFKIEDGRLIINKFEYK